MTLTPAYGRDYKSAEAAKADWNAGKDFRMSTTGQYTSIRDQEHFDEIWIRYKKLTEKVRVK